MSLVLELQELFKNNEMSANTKKTYQTSYNRLVNSGLFSKSITDTPNLEIIENIKSITDKAESRNALITICVRLKKYSNESIIELEHFRVQNATDRLTEIKTKKSDVKSEGINLKTLLDNEDKLLQSNLYVKYIVNYLMNHYGVRNQDVNVLIIKNKKSIKPNENYLLVSKSKVDYIRDNYKTRNVYGLKTITIKDKKFINAVLNLNREDGEPLLITKTGDRLSSESQNRVIQDLTYNGLGEGRICKILVSEYKYNEKKMNELSLSRGTNINDIMKHYTNEDLTK